MFPVLTVHGKILYFTSAAVIRHFRSANIGDVDGWGRNTRENGEEVRSAKGKADISDENAKENVVVGF